MPKITPACVAAAVKCFSDLLRYRQGFIDRDGALLDPVRECWPLDQLKDERLRAFTIFETVNGSDVRMVEGCEDLRLSLEPCQPIRI